MVWSMSHRADKDCLPLADRHYNRQKPGTPQLVPPGRCVVLKAEGAVWVTSWPFAEYVKADDIDAALRRAKAEGLKEAEQYALTCLKELQDKICDIELGKYTLVGSQTKEGVAEWVHAKTLQAGRMAKWITARIAEVEADARAAQIEKGEHDDSHTSND